MMKKLLAPAQQKMKTIQRKNQHQTTIEKSHYISIKMVSIVKWSQEKNQGLNQNHGIQDLTKISKWN